MTIYYLYILYAPKSDKYYIGQTSDLNARLKDHNEGERPNQKKKFTYKYRPWELALAIPMAATRAEAMRIEKFVKSKKSRAFIQQLVQAKEDEEKIALLLRVPIQMIGIHQ